MTRRAALALLVVLVLIVGLSGALVFWRVLVAQVLLDRHLESLGIPGARLTIAEIATDRMRLSDLSAGEAGEIAAGSLDLRYNLPDLLDGRVARVEIRDPSVRLDLREGGAPFGSLQPLVDNLAAEAGTASGGAQGRGDTTRSASRALPHIRVSGGEVRLFTPLGTADVTLDGDLLEDEDGALDLGVEVLASSPFGSLQGRLTAAGDPGADLAGAFEISGGRLAGPEGEFRADAVEGRMTFATKGGAPSAATAALAFEGLRLAGTELDSAELRFELTETDASVHGRIHADDGSLDLALDGQVNDLRGNPRVELQLTSDVAAQSPLASLAPFPWPDAGRSRLHGTVSGDLPPVDRLPESLESLRAWLARGAFTGRVEADLEDVAFGETGPQISASTHWSTAWDGAALTLALADDSSLEAAGIDAVLLHDLGLSAGLAEQVIALTGGALSLRLPANAPRPARATWRPADGASELTIEASADLVSGPMIARISGLELAGNAEGATIDRAVIDQFVVNGKDFTLSGFEVADLALTGSFEGAPEAFDAEAEVHARLREPAAGDLSARQVELTLPMQVRRQIDRAAITLAAPGRITADGLRLAGGFAAVDPVRIAIDRSDVTLHLDNNGAPGLTYAHRTDLSVGRTQLDLPQNGGDPIRLDGEAARISLTGRGGLEGPYRGAAKIADANLALPDFELALDGLTATVALPGDPDRATALFEVAALRHTGAPEAFAPLRFTGEIKRNGHVVELTARAHGPGEQPLADMAARHDLTDGTGRAEVTFRPLRFAPGGLQPGQLSPLLAAIQEATGVLDGTADLAWDNDGASGTARLALDGMGFSTKGIAVEGLRLHLALDELVPPSSPPGQTLSAEVVDVGVPLEGVDASFRLPPDAPGRIFVEQARFSLAGGAFAVRETLIDPTSGRAQAQLLVDQLELAHLFETLAVEGLSGEGRLAGTIPLSLEGDRLVIKNARLSSVAPGVLRFRSQTASSALQTGGPAVELMLQALENFHFDTLAVTGELDREDEANLRLEILGRNPDVLDAHPFQININLTGNLGPILEAVRQGHEITRDLLRRSWRLGP